jgi:hypothetical protein
VVQHVSGERQARSAPRIKLTPTVNGRFVSVHTCNKVAG